MSDLRSEREINTFWTLRTLVNRDNLRSDPSRVVLHITL